VSRKSKGKISVEPAPELRLHHIWFELVRRRTFRSLGLVAADECVPVSPLAHGLARVAGLGAPGSVLLVDADTPASRQSPSTTPAGYQLVSVSEDTTEEALLAVFVPQVKSIIESSSTEASPGGTRKYSTIIVAAAHPQRHIASIPLVRSTDAAVLCVQLGTTRIAAAKRAQAHFAPELLLGSLVCFR
jgi:hypothetical protein